MTETRQAALRDDVAMKRGAVATVTVGVALVGLAYASAFLPGGVPEWAAWLFVLGMPVSVLGFLVLGASRPGRGVGRLVLPIAFVFLVLLGGFAAALLLPEPTSASPLWLGLPPGAAVVIYGVGLLPLFVLPMAYALTFDEQTLSLADLERVRAAARLAGAAPGSTHRSHAVAVTERDEAPLAAIPHPERR